MTALLCLGGVVRAQEARIAARIVAGRLMIRCDISTPARRIPVHLLLEFENSCALQVHDQALQALRIDRGYPLTLNFPGFRITTSTWELGPQALFDDFTKLYAQELGETAVVGTVGAGLLKDYHVVFDLASGVIELSRPRPRSEERPEGAIPVDLAHDLVWLPVQLSGSGKSGTMGLGSARYDTAVDRDLCRAAGRPAGDIGALLLDGTDLSRYVAFRPAELLQTHRDGAVGMTGINLLRHFRVEVDRVNRFVTVTETAPAKFPARDLAFFKAMVTGKADPVEAWLKEHAQARLGREAARLLLDRRFEEGAQDAESMNRALTWVVETWPEDLRTTQALDLMKKVAEYGMPGYVIKAGELGLPTGRKDRDPNAVHKIHGTLGALQLDRGERKKAWRHLLSAAFGMPEDGRVNLALGRFYEREKRYTRAFSRYVQAVVKAETSPQAMAGLERVQRLMGEGDAISVEVVDRLIAGKVPGFAAGDTFIATEKDSTNRVVLAELFSNVHARGSLCADLAFNGIRTHFPRERVAILVHHIAGPQMEPLVNPASETRARELGLRLASLAAVNGWRKMRMGGREEHKEPRYLQAKDAVLAELARNTRYSVALEAKLDKDALSGSVVVKGPGLSGRKVKVYLAEKGVVYAGRSRIVIHRMVVRGLLADADYESGARVAFQGNLGTIRGELDRYHRKVEEQGGGMVSSRAPRIDPDQVTIVAFVHDTASGEVLQAVQKDPARPEREFD